jgi:hypothetical protein
MGRKYRGSENLHAKFTRIAPTGKRQHPPAPLAFSKPETVQFVNVPHCDAMRSAPRCDRAKIVNVGFEAPSVGKMPGPATQRFGISWLWP